MTLTIDDLLNALESEDTNSLQNTKDTWSRIGNKDQFLELGLDINELDGFLKEWIDNNPYSAI